MKNKIQPTSARVLAYRERENTREFLIIQGNTGRYALIGGAKDREDNDLEDTIRREFLEEVGYQLADEKIINTGIIREFTYTAHNDRMGERGVDLNFIIKLDSSTKLKKTSHITNYYWMPFEEACEKISFNDLKEIFIKLQELI